MPFDLAFIERIAEDYPTPFYIYEEAGIRESVKKLQTAFAWNKGFKEYFAVKALPNPHILAILRELGCGADCSSLPELVLAQRADILGENIMFTSNETPAAEYSLAKELGAVINLDDITHIEYLEKNCDGLPELVCFRYNPGPLREAETVIGRPEEAKYGLTKEQIFEAYASVKSKGAKRFGLHTMVASNLLEREFFVETAKMLFELAVELKERLDIRLEFVNLGGGIGIPYRPGQESVDIEKLGREIEKLYENMIVPAGLDPLKIFMENGRCITGPHGFLVMRAIHKKHIYRDYVGVDGCMANLMRPGMYGAYHHVSVLGKDESAQKKVIDIVGSLCENNDKFAIARELPEIEIGDYVVVHDAGAHGHAMGFQYNGKLRCAELLMQTDGIIKMIRRAETLNDYFATLDF